MISPESLLHQPQSFSKLQMPNMPGLNGGQNDTAQPNPFSGIRRAGQAKREQNFEKFQQRQNGAKNQNFGGQAGTLNGSMRQMKFS
jgi:hypothetical protein